MADMMPLLTSSTSYGAPTELVQPLRSSPLWTLLHRGLSARPDTAIVFETGSGDFRARGGSVGQEKPYGRWFGIGSVLLRRFLRAYRVNLAGRQDSFTVPLVDFTIPWNAEVAVSWHVSDPIQLVIRSLQHVDEVRPHIRRSVLDRLRTRVGEHLQQPSDEASDELWKELRGWYSISDLGISYRVGHVVLSDADDPSDVTADASPRYWDPSRREEFQFYKNVVHGGRTALLSLWLMSDSVNVREVLDWMRDNPEPEEPTRAFDAELANLFSNLDEAERSLLRRVAVHTLDQQERPGGKALLHRLVTQEGAEGSTNGDVPAPGVETSAGGDGSAVPGE